MRFLSLLLISLAFLSGCLVKDHSDNLSVTKGYWGNSLNVDEIPEFKLFLINLKKNQTYNICIPKYFKEKYVGIENEILAAAKIWGHYIGRNPKIKISVAEIPSDDEVIADDVQLLRDIDLCPKDTDMLIGETMFSDNTVGETFYKFKTNKRGVILDNYRGLFIKKSNDEENYKWVTLSQFYEKDFSEEEILNFLKSRSNIEYIVEGPKKITLLTLVHEFGHVWGLCDQYSNNRPGNGCDPANSKINEQGHIVLEPKSVMGSRSDKNKFYLADDDIEGIRHLASRKNLNYGYPNTKEFEKIEVAPEAPESLLPVVSLKELEVVKENRDNKFFINLALFTNTPVKITYRFYSKESGKEPEAQTEQHEEGPVSFRNYRYRFTYSINAKIHWTRVEIDVQGVDEDGESVGKPILLEELL